MIEVPSLHFAPPPPSKGNKFSKNDEHVSSNVLAKRFSAANKFADPVGIELSLL